MRIKDKLIGFRLFFYCPFDQSPYRRPASPWCVSNRVLVFIACSPPAGKPAVQRRAVCCMRPIAWLPWPTDLIPPGAVWLRQRRPRALPSRSGNAAVCSPRREENLTPSGSRWQYLVPPALVLCDSFSSCVTCVCLCGMWERAPAVGAPFSGGEHVAMYPRPSHPTLRRYVQS